MINTFKDTDDLLNPRCVDDFDWLQQESTRLHFGPEFWLVVWSGLSRELEGEIRKDSPTYSVEEENSNRVRRTDDGLPFLNLHSGIERA